MTDLLHTIPDFPTKSYTHLLPSLEKNLITTTDLLTLDALDVAKRAHLPLLDVRRLKEHVLAALQGQLGLKSEFSDKFEDVGEGAPGFGALRRNGHEIVKSRGCISTLDPALDKALDGGIRTRYITEITGESGAGKTQLLLTLLLSAQLPVSSVPLSSPGGLDRATCYISTEHALPTTRVQQILRTNPVLSQSLQPPSMSRILTLQTPDLESQDHILTYQLPIALARHNIGLIIIDSITANYRAQHNTPAALATRSTQLIKLGSLLRNLAREHDCAIVVANQVGDRFTHQPTTSATTNPSFAPGGAGVARSSLAAAGPNALFSSSPASTPSTIANSHSHTSSYFPTVLSLDHQQRFFTGWGDSPPSHAHVQQQNLKTPSLGLVWANQIACRIVLVKEESYDRTGGVGNEGSRPSAEWTAKKWRRWMRVVFAPWVAGCDAGEGGKGVEFEVWGGGVRSCGGVGNGDREVAGGGGDVVGEGDD